MTFSTRATFWATRYLFAAIVAVCGVGFGPAAFAQSAVITGTIRTPVPGFSAPLTLNLRAQGVIGGAAPLVIQQATFSDRLIETTILQMSPGSVCIQLRNIDFTLDPERLYSMDLIVSNGSSRDTGTVPVVFGGGTTTSPTDPACADPAPPSNRPPVARAGDDREITFGTPVTLDGSASSDPDGPIPFYEWRNAQGTLIARTAIAQVEGLPVGVHTFSLTVSDAGQLSSEDSVTITVVSPRVQPIARPTSAPSSPIIDTNGAGGEPVRLDGSASTDADGRIVSWVWLNAAGVQIATGETPAPIPLADGTHDLTLVVTDNEGLTGRATLQVVVNPPRAPTANAGADQSVAAGTAVTLSAAASTDPDGTIVSRVWTSAGMEAVSAPTLTRIFPVGANEVTLTVTDNVGLTATDIVRVIVTALPQPPVADAGPDQSVADEDGLAGELVTLSGTATDPDSAIARYRWSFGETAIDGQTVQVRVPDGIADITLTVTDSTDLIDTDVVRVTVAAPNRAPTASAGDDQTILDSNGAAGEPVTLTGSGTDTDGTIASYEWRSGDTLLGRTATLTTPLSDGVNTITLIVTDDDGATDDDTVQITVSPPDTPEPQPPVASAGVDQSIPDNDGIGGELVTLTGTATDPDGGALTYAWFLGEGTLGTGPSLSVRLPNGANTVTLVVTDNTERSGTDTAVITVGAPSAPIVSAGADQTRPDTDGADGELVSLTGTATDADGTIASTRWSEGEGTLSTTATVEMRLANGLHTLTFTATDNAGLSTSDTVQITVSTAQAPTVSAGADQTVPDSDGAAGELVTLTATASDTDGTIESYQWLLGETSLGTTQTLQTRISDGVNTVTLRVIDSSGVSATDTVQITVTAPARPPTANAGADQNIADADGQLGELVTLTGTGTDPDGTIASYQWLNGTTVLGTSATLPVRLPDGVSTLTLVVTDNAGLTATDTMQATISAPVLPIVDAGVARTIEDTDVQVGETVQLTGSATGTIARYEWFLGSNSLGVGSSISARLPDGINLVTLRATSTVNRVGSATVQITVATPVRTVLRDIPGLTPNELRLAQKLDETCNNVLGPIEGGEGGETPTAARAEKRRPPTEADVSDFAQKCRGLLISRDTAALRGAMGALLGDDFAVARTQTLLFANTQYASVMDRLIALRGGAKGLSLAGLNIIVDGELVPLAELQDLAKTLFGGGASSDADSWGEKWGLWMRGNYSFGSKEEDSLSPSFDADQFALLAGLDYRLSSSAVIGAALAYGNSTVEFNPSNEGSLDTTNWALSMYGSLYAKKNFYFDAIVNVADAGYEAERNITYVDGYGLVNSDASGDTGGITLSAGMSGGYDFLIGGLTLSPTIGVFYIDAQIDEFTESGAGGLNLIYDEQQFKSLTGNLGLRMTFAWNLPWGVLLPHLRADFVREFDDEVDVFGIRFAADPNAASTPPILVETENADTSYWRFAAGFSAQFKHGISGYVEYQRLASFQSISFQDVSLGLRFQRTF
jgi:uncharacterized protein YhjY with autotransporter beta-barrel domain